jgi:hypothetical protein
VLHNQKWKKMEKTNKRLPETDPFEWLVGGDFGVTGRHPGFTYKHNLFEHIGEHSAFPGRDNQASKRDGDGGTKTYDIPQCFEYNWYLLPEERFDKEGCGHVDFTPCK